MSDADRDKWDERYRLQLGSPSAEPSLFLREKVDLLPALPARVLDVAGGGGRNALWLAERGLEVTLVDVSRVGLQLAHQRAAQRGLTLHTYQADLEREALPAGPWDAAVCILYLQRRLFAELARVLAPGARLFFLQPTTINLARHPRPPRQFLLFPGELGALAVEAGLEVEALDESWSPAATPEQSFHEGRLVARRPL